MMLWRSLTGRTICQAAEAVASRRSQKTTEKSTAAASAMAADVKVAATIVPADATTRGSGTV